MVSICPYLFIAVFIVPNVLSGPLVEDCVNIVYTKSYCTGREVKQAKAAKEVTENVSKGLHAPRDENAAKVTAVSKAASVAKDVSISTMNLGVSYLKSVTALLNRPTVVLKSLRGQFRLRGTYPGIPADVWINFGRPFQWSMDGILVNSIINKSDEYLIEKREWLDETGKKATSEVLYEFSDDQLFIKSTTAGNKVMCVFQERKPLLNIL